MPKRIRGADIVARTLDAAGLRTVFTLSGNHIMSLFDAALDTGLRLIHVRHEAAAVHMADAWGRLNGQCGIVWVSGGAGPRWRRRSPRRPGPQSRRHRWGTRWPRRRASPGRVALGRCT